MGLLESRLLAAWIGWTSVFARRGAVQQRRRSLAVRSLAVR
jgi:hypothetical protein